MGPDTQHRQQSVHWLAAYALGVAFSVANDAAACAQLMAVTSDRAELQQARDLLGRTQITDAGTRERATALLSYALRFTEPAPYGAATAAGGVG